MKLKIVGIPTYVVTTNQLAGEYIVRILSDDGFARPIICEQLPQPRLRSMPTVFVVEGSVPIPLRELTRRLQSLFSKGKFIMVDRPQLDEEVMRLIKLGFHGFVEHSEVEANLAEAVRAVVAGRIWISNEQMNMYLHRKVKAEHGSTEEPSFPTARETEILQLIRQRFSNPEIAEILQLSVHTVKCHVSHILSKCCVASRRELETRAQLGPSRIWEQLGGAGSKPRHLTK